MPYIDSKGNQKDPKDMPYPYLVNALKKAQDFGNNDNIEALQAEILSRPDPEQ